MKPFYSLLENNPIANTTLTYRSVTVFAPANLAFQKYTGKVDDTLVLYHMRIPKLLRNLCTRAVRNLLCSPRCQKLAKDL
ncbi:fatty acid synthase beta subunit fas1 [Homalodisca vitripennis]|nr:fatty acid synthase beta subunit fas1 [Homalodisca vitripennis]